MRSGFCLLLFAAACSSAPPEEPLTADSFTDMFIASYVTPTPATILSGVNLPLHAGDRVIANCAQAYAYTLPEMTIDEQAEFNANVTCVYPPEETFEASFRHYALALRQQGFEDDTGDYVQSGMRIVCNQTHTVVMAIQANFVPSFVVDPETEKVIDTPGGGGLANMALAFTVSDRPCEHIAMMRDTSDPPAPDNYAARSSPDVLPVSTFAMGDVEVPLRPGDQLVSYCSQYYAHELKLAPGNFAEFNRDHSCILVRGNVEAAAAHYLDLLAGAGFDRESPWAAPHPESRAPESVAGVHAWSGRVSRCGQKASMTLIAVARFGRMKLLDPLSGEVWSTLGPSGGREALLPEADTPNAALIFDFMRFGCNFSE